MRMGQGVKTGLGHGGITCALQTQFSFFFTEHFACSFNCQGIINQFQILTLFILKPDNIAKLRIELKGFLLLLPSNKIKRYRY